jgi:hypothetical protein
MSREDLIIALKDEQDYAEKLTLQLAGKLLTD